MNISEKKNKSELKQKSSKQQKRARFKWMNKCKKYEEKRVWNPTKEIQSLQSGTVCTKEIMCRYNEKNEQKMFLQK